MALYDEDFRPMLLDEVSKPFNDPDYLFEMKLDGMRALIYVDPKKVRIINRRLNVLNDTYPELQTLKYLVKTKCIFDGEIISMVNGFPSFNKLQERILLKNPHKIKYMQENFPVTFVAFDIIYEGKDLTNLPLLQRKKILNKYLDTTYFVKTTYIKEKGISFYEEIKKLNLEGIIAKKINSKYYINTRSKEWLKIKNWYDEEFWICGYNEDSPYVASLLLGYEDNKELKYAAKVIIGKNKAEYKIIKKCQTSKKSPLIDYDKSEFTFLKPTLKCTVEYLEKTKHNHLRQPVYKGIRYD